MGMCLYAIKARFRSGQLKKIFPDIVEFWKQGTAAHQWYQANRSRCGSYYQSRSLKKKEAKAFQEKKEAYWAEFKTKFPLIAEMLKGVKEDGHVDGKWQKHVPVLTLDPSSSLSGQIEFGDDPDSWERLAVFDNILYFEDEMWSMSNLTPLANYLKKKFKATKVRWISEDEKPGLFEAIPV